MWRSSNNANYYFTIQIIFYPNNIYWLLLMQWIWKFCFSKNINSVQLCSASDIKKKFDMRSPCISFLIFFRLSFAGSVPFSEKKIDRGSPIEGFFTVFRRQTPSKKTFTLPSFHPPSLKLQGTNHANDIFYVYKFKTHWYFLHLF